MRPDSPTVLSWHSLIERVYQQLDAVLAADGGDGAAPSWEALLDAAAEHFELEGLHVHAGSAPAHETTKVLYISPSAVPLLSRPGLLDAPGRAETVEAREAWHLVAHLTARPQRPPCWHSQLAEFADHLAQCRALQERLQAEHERLDRLHRCLDAQATAAVLCDAQGKAVRANTAARELAERVPGLHLGPGSVSFVSSEGKEILAPLFACAEREHGVSPVCRWVSISEGLGFTLLALTGRGEDGNAAPGLGLVIQERTLGAAEPIESRPLPPPPAQLRLRLQKRFGLTTREFDLAHALGLGLSIGSYAERCHRSPQTLRTQIKSIYTKLDVHDQKSLVLRVWQERQADWVESVRLLLGEAPSETRVRSAPTLSPPIAAKTALPRLAKSEAR